MIPAQSGRAVSNSLYQISAWLRVLVNTSVVAADFDLLDHVLQHRDAEMAAPGDALGLVGQQRVDDQRLVELAAHQHRLAMRPDQRAPRAVEIAERRR